MDIKEVVKEMCNLMPGGRSAMAGALGMSSQTFKNKLYEANGCRFFEISDLEVMEDYVGQPLLAEYFAKRASGTFIKLPDAEDLDQVELFNLSVSADAKKAILSLGVSKALEDGVIDIKEKKAILQALHGYLTAEIKEVSALIDLYKS